MKDIVGKSTLTVAAAMAFAIGAASVLPTAAQAADGEKCYGVAKAGQNDCKTAHNECAGHSKEDAAKGAFLVVPEGTCEKLVGGSLEAM